jgi:uncharacterized protein YgbK (DUF1537 family)
VNARARPLVVLDDDPTGTQSVAGVRVLFEWSDASLVRSALAGRPAVYLLTNSRAYPARRAYELVAGAARAAVEALGRPRILLRGDSTLRAHLLEEYLAVCDAAHGGPGPPLLLVPALPAAGRVTVGGVHLIERGGSRTPLHETEYAGDAGFAYRDARLLQWAEDRSEGLFPRSRGREIPLACVRAEGPAAVAAALLELARAGAPSVCVPDAETVGDLEVIADGLEAAEEAGAEVVVRSAPAFAGVLGRCLAAATAPAPAHVGGLLVVCGSYVPLTTRQLAVLLEERPGTLVEVDVLALASADPEAELARAAAAAGGLLREAGFAVVATPRERHPSTQTLAAGARIAENLARILVRLEPRPGIVLAKGGITSAVTAHVGLGARRAEVLGPLAPGVALWSVDSDLGSVPYVVFPGNVGDERALADVVSMLLDR